MTLGPGQDTVTVSRGSVSTSDAADIVFGSNTSSLASDLIYTPMSGAMVDFASTIHGQGGPGGSYSNAGYGVPTAPGDIIYFGTTSIGSGPASTNAPADWIVVNGHDFARWSGSHGMHEETTANTAIYNSVTQGGNACVVVVNTATQTLSANVTDNSLCVQLASAGTINLNGYTLNLENNGAGQTALDHNGGIIISGTADYLASGGYTITGGTLTSGTAGTNSELLVWIDSNTTTINSVIANIGGGATTLLSKNGSGTLVLGGANTYSYGTTINGGVLQFANGSLPISNIQFYGGTLQWATGNTQDVSAGIAPIAAGQAAIIDTNGNPVTFATGLSGAGGLTKVGANTLALSANNTYTGPTAVDNGALCVTGTIAAGSAVSVGDQVAGHTAVLEGTGLVGGPVTVLGPGASGNGAVLAPGVNTSGNFGGAGTLTLGGLTLSSSAVLDMDLGTSSDLVVVNGLLTLSGATINVQNSGGIATGNYEIIGYGSLAAFSTGSLVVGTMPTGFVGTVYNNSSGTSANYPVNDAIYLDVQGPIYWTGANGTAWDTVTANWTTKSSTATYSDGAPVLFDDTAAPNGSVTIAGTVQPLSIAVSATSLAYTFSGTGSIAGNTGLVKSGAGTLAITMTGNTYTGGTTLSGGVLQIGASSTVSGGSLQSGPLGVGTIILSGGTLQDSGSGWTLANAVDITGNVTLGSAGANGLTLDSQGLGNVVTLTNSPVLTVTAPTTIADQIVSSSGLTMAGSGLLVLTATNNYTGLTTVSGGTLQLGNGTNGSVGSTSGFVTNGVLAFDLSVPTTVSQNISGTGGLTQMADSVLTLTGNNSYRGATFIAAGTLQAGSSTALGDPSAVTMNAGTVLDLDGNSLTIASLNDGTGLGTVTNSVASSVTLTLQPASGSATFSGVIQNGTAGAQTSLTMDGPAVQVLAGVNTYSGPTTITAGTLQIGNGVTGSIGSTSGFAIAPGGLLAFNLPGTNTLTAPVSGGGGLQQMGGTLVLGGAATYTGPTIISGGSLQVAAASLPVPVVHLAMNGSGTISNGGTIADSSPNGFNATMHGSGASYVSGGPFGGGINANGRSLIIPANPAFDLLQSWTDSVWVELSNTGVNGCLVGCRDYDPMHGLVEGYNNGTLTAALASATGGWFDTNIAANVSLSANTWYMITLTVNATGQQFYLDGVPVTTSGQATGRPQMVGSDDNNVQPNVSKLTIGAYSSGGEDSIADASFADFNLFGVVLTQSQITALYQGTVGALPAASPVQIGSAGVLDLGGYSQTVASLSDITLGSGGLVTNSVGGPVTLTLAPPAGAATFSGVIQNGAGQTSLTVNGVGTQVLAGSNTYTGVTTIASGTLQLGAGGGTGSIDNSSGVLDSGILAFSRSDTVTFALPVSGSGGLTQLGPGVLALTGNNSYSGPTTINGGTLQPVSGSALGNTSGVVIDTAGALDLAGNSLTIPSLSDGSNGGGLVTNSVAVPVTLTLAPTGGSTTFSGSIQDGTPGAQTSLTLNGPGVQVLAGANTYSGLTTISVGTLEAKTTAALPNYNNSGYISVASGAMLAVNAGGPGEWNSGVSDDIAALAASASFATGATLGIDTTDATSGLTYSARSAAFSA